jgi:hypothetical protein
MLSQTLVGSSDLVSWAARNSAADHLPTLLRKLILATVTTSNFIAFPADEAVHLGGWDGRARVREGNAFVPDGDSAWEMGKEDNPKGKADSDYTKRTGNPGETHPIETTFVFVTPRRWKGKEAWARTRSAEGVWREVRAYDADDLATWLETAPAVHIWFSWLLGKRPDGAEDLERFWRNWSHVTKPPTAPEVVVAGRDDLAAQLREWIVSAPSALGLRTDTQDEAMAFLAAAIEGMAPAERACALARAVVVDDPPAFRHLVGSGQKLLLVPRFSDPPLSVEAVQNGHHVLIALARNDAAVGPTLDAPRRRREPIEKALMTSGMDRGRAAPAATLARRSLTAFRRSLSTVPGFRTPPWAQPQSSRQILPALLAEQWRDDSEGDREIISRLAGGRSYEEVSTTLSEWAALPDAPVRRIGDVWLLASKEDAWRLVASHLMPRDLDTFCEAALTVLGEVDPTWDLDPDQRFMAGFLGVQPRYSPFLRKGMASTLAVLTARADGLPPSVVDAEARAEGVVRQLLADANQDWRLWASLSDELPLLAEAGPEALLDRLSEGMSTVLPLFAGQGSPLFTSPPHVGILWALETLAWNPDLLGQSALILAAMARQDPGVGNNHANRPLNSLRDIFFCWFPQTAAPFEQRLRVIDSLRKKEPEVAWLVLPSLIPREGGVMRSCIPTWRDWVPEGQGRASDAELRNSASEAATRLLEDAGSDGQRWEAVIELYPNLPRPDRERVANRIAEIGLSELPGEETLRIRRSIEDMVAQHREFPDAPWALPAGETDRLAAIAERFTVSDPVVRHAWLFSAHPNLPDVRRGEDWDDHEKAVRSRRFAALGEIVAAGGIVSVQALAERCESPWVLGQTVGHGDLLNDGDMDALLGRCLASEVLALKECGHSLIIGRFDRYGWPWADAKRSDPSVSGHSPSQRAAFYGGLPRLRSTWHRLEEESEETQRHYWAPWPAYRLEENDAYEYAARALLRFDQPLTALHLMRRPGEKGPLPVADSLAVQALEAALLSPAEHWDKNRGVAQDIPDILDALAASESVGEDVLVSLEWQYLPLLERKRLPAVLHRKLARDPEFFITAVKIAFKARHAEHEEVPEDERLRAKMAHKMLRGWREIPGTDAEGNVSFEKLLAWVSQARELAAQCDRTEMTDQLIGQVLTFSPKDPDGGWPHSAVRDLIETVASGQLEKGFAIQVYNNRGVTTRLPTDGGSQEREMVAHYEQAARAVGDQWPRTAAVLRRLAATYGREAEHEDLSAELTEDEWT